MKAKMLAALALLAISGTASCATLADGIQGEFSSLNGSLVLKVKNDRKDVSVQIARVALLLPQHSDEKSSPIAFQTAEAVDVAPGKDAVIKLLPVSQLTVAMQQRGEAPSAGYANVFVENAPGKCGECGGSQSYSAKSVGFGAQTIVALSGTADVTTLFGGYLVFANR